MYCIKCNGAMHGDGYSTVEVCENLDEESEQGQAAQYAAPDEGPFYCGFEEPRQYTVRREVLNMSMKMWDKLGGESAYTGTAKNFLDTIGLPGLLTARTNSEENEFSAEIYAIARGRL